MSGEFAVELKSVTKKFNEVTAVNQVSLKIQHGEFFSLLGPSGCGKTTTLRLIGGFEVPTSGEVLIENIPQGFTPPYKRPVNTVFQNYALFPHMNVFQNVAFGLQMQKVPKEEIRQRVIEMLELVQLPGMENRKPNQLSGGQQQRVALARALINHPKVLLLDEPLGALDLKLRKAMQLELKALQQRVGITFIYVTHDQEEALTMSDRIAVMSKGKVLQLGEPEEIYEKPTNRFVADFIGETNFLEGRVEAIEASQVKVLVDETVDVSIPLSKEVNPGQNVTLAVRPEKLALQNSPEGKTGLSGKIEEIIYIGTDIRYLVRITPQTILTVREQNRGGTSAKRFANNDDVFVCWADEHINLLID